MLQLYNLNKEKIEGLTKYKDLKIESTLSTGDKVLSFSYPKKCSNNIIEEGYIRTKEAEFVIKQVDKSLESFVNVTCNLNVEELENMIEEFNSTEQTIEKCINFALVGTGWTVKVDSSITKKRTVRKTNSSIWDIIQQARKTYSVEIEFDTINKIVVVKEKIGGDKGVYFTDELNLKSLSIQSNSYDFYTRILAIGKDDLKVEVENYNYSNKRKTLIWKDERYTDETSLREDAILKLNEISKPYRSYSADVIDLAKLNEKYKDILDYKLGDTITLISKDNRIREKQRIVKIVEYPDNPENNTVEIANTTLSFEDVQKEFQETTDTVNNITTDNGTVDGSAIDGISTEQIYDFEANIAKITNLEVINAHIKNLYAEKATIQELNAVIANVGELNATKANITDLTAINAKIVNLQADKANITDLTAINIKFNVGSGGTLDLQTLLTKHITGENGQFLNITSSNTVIANAVIKDAMIENISVNKLLAGTISTNKFTISSDDGGIQIVGPTMQFKDKNNKVRIQIGQDTQGSFNFILRGEDGTTTLIDHTGIKEKAIADDLIKSNMVAADAIGEKQINYSSLITGLNKDTNTSLIKASKVAIDLTGQSLEVSFNSLKSNIDGLGVGGRNLAFSTSFEKIDSNITIMGTGYTVTPFVNKNDYNGTDNSIEWKVANITQDKWLGLGINTSLDNTTLVKGEVFTISFYYYVFSDTECDSTFSLTLKNHTLNKCAFTKNIPTNIKDKWVKLECTGIVDEDVLLNNRTLYIYLTRNGHVKVSKVKLEKGNKATDYTEAPEDTDSKIESNTTAITVAQGKIEGIISENSIIRGDITTITDKYMSLKATVDGINTTVASHTSSITTIKNTADSANNKIDSLEIGGRNLLIIKTKIANKYLNESNGSLLDSAIGASTSDYIFATSSKDYTLSYQGSITGNCRVVFYDSNKTYISGLLYYYNKLFSWIFKTPSNCAYIRVSSPDFDNSKLEFGNKATDWTPAPEDVYGAINEVNTKVTTVENKYTSLEQNLNGFKTTVSNTYSTKTEVSNLSGTVSSLTSKVSTVESNITQLNNKIDLKVEATEVNTIVNNAIIGVEIGGRNLAFSTSFEKIDSNITIMGTGYTVTPFVNKNDYNGTYNSIEWKVSGLTQDKWLGLGINTSLDKTTLSKGEIFTISFWYYIFSDTVCDSSFCITLKNHSLNKSAFTKEIDTNIKDKWVKLEYTGTVNGDIILNNRTLYIYLTRNGHVKVSKVKLEKGNKATDYSVAPEDVESSISTVSNKVATIETNLNSITSRVSTTEQTTTTINGDITNLTSRVNSAESKLTATSLTTTISESITNGTTSITTTQFIMDKNGLTIKNGSLSIWNKSNTQEMIYLGSDGNVVFGGNIRMELASNRSKYIEIKAVPYSTDIGCKLVLGGSTLDNSFSIENPSSIKYFWVNREGTYISNNLCITSDQKDTSPTATDVIFDDGAIYPAYGNKGLLGTDARRWKEINGTTARIYDLTVENSLSTKAINTNNSNINAGTGSITCGSGTVNGAFSVTNGLKVRGTLDASDIDCTSIITNGNSINAGNGIVTCGGVSCSGNVAINGYYAIVGNGSTTSKQVKGLSVLSGTSTYMEIQMRNGSLYGVNVWASDIKIKENIELIETSKVKVLDNNKIGLEAVLSIEHYGFDYKDKNLNHVSCGYIAQQLIEVNKNFAYNVKQENGTDMYCPDVSALIPTLSLAIKQQQEYIKALEERIKLLESA